MQDSSLVNNDTVVLVILFILVEEFVYYGYSKTTDELRENGFVINYKKCYRIMKEHRLLCGHVIGPVTGKGKRKFVKWRVQQASRPMEQLCMDIKYIHVHGQNRDALLLTVPDVYTRSIVGPSVMVADEKGACHMVDPPHTWAASGCYTDDYFKE